MQILRVSQQQVELIKPQDVFNWFDCVFEL